MARHKFTVGLAMRLLLAGLLMSLTALDHHAVRAADLGQPQHKIAVQISSGNPDVQNMALNNTVNLITDLGMDNVQIEVVAYGPGLSIMTDKSVAAERVRSLEKQGVKFSACHNTMEAVERKTGKMPVLLDGVGIVPSGASRIVELQEKGYTYLRP